MECATKSELADAVGVKTRAVYHWLKLADFPGGKDGPWDPDLVRAWSVARRSKSATRGRKAAIPVNAPAEGPGTQGLLPLDPDARYRLAKAELAELKLKQERGRLVERDRVQTLLDSRAADLKSDLLDIPRAAAHRVIGKTERQVETILTDAIVAVLAKFVRKQGLHDLLEDGGNAA